MAQDQQKWVGVIVENPQVQSYVREHGTPVHTKPHGAGKTVLYYRDTAAEKEDGPTLKDYAGERTPGNRSYIVQQPIAGGTEIGSNIVARKISAGRSPTTGSGAKPGNPNRTAEDAQILNEDQADEEIQKIEEDQKKKAAEAAEATLSVEQKTLKVKQELTGETPDVELPHEKAREEKKSKSDPNSIFE